MDMRFTTEEAEALYEGYRGPEYLRLREDYEPGYTARNDRLNGGIEHMREIEAFLRPHLPARPAVLDWGGDTGKNSPFRTTARQIDVYDISGKETLPGIRSVARDQLAAGAHDLFVSMHVIEHTAYPFEHLEEIVPLMSDDAILYIETPFERLMREHAGARNLHERKKHWHEHINFYSRPSLERLVARLGLDVVAYNELEAEVGAHFNRVFQVACRKNGGPR